MTVPHPLKANESHPANCKNNCKTQFCGKLCCFNDCMDKRNPYASFIDSYGCDSHSSKQSERDTCIKLLEEIEGGITTYEKENQYHQVFDDCLGIYIPTNVVRRLISVRKEKLRHSSKQGEP